MLLGLGRRWEGLLPGPPPPLLSASLQEQSWGQRVTFTEQLLGARPVTTPGQTVHRGSWLRPQAQVPIALSTSLLVPKTQPETAPPSGTDSPRRALTGLCAVALVADPAQALQALVDAAQLLLQLRVPAVQDVALDVAQVQGADDVLVDFCKTKGRTP